MPSVDSLFEGEGIELRVPEGNAKPDHPTAEAREIPMDGPGGLPADRIDSGVGPGGFRVETGNALASFIKQLDANGTLGGIDIDLKLCPVQAQGPGQQGPGRFIER